MLGKYQCCLCLMEATDWGRGGSKSFTRKESPPLPTINIFDSQSLFLLTSVPLVLAGTISLTQAAVASRIPGCWLAGIRDKMQNRLHAFPTSLPLTT